MTELGLSLFAIKTFIFFSCERGRAEWSMSSREGKSSEGKSSEGKVSSSGAPSSRSSNLIKKLTKKVLKGMSKLRFKEWFSEEEVDQFRDNADLSRMEPLFHRWQDNMEELLTRFAAEEGLESPSEIINALEECRSDTGDWKTLNNLINSMTEKEVSTHSGGHSFSGL